MKYHSPTKLVECLLEDAEGTPPNPELASHVKAWLAMPDAGTDVGDEAIMAAAVAAGAMTPEEAIEAYVEPGAREHNLVHIFLGAGPIIELRDDGSSTRIV